MIWYIKKALIAIFINAVYLYDDRARIIFNASDRPVEVDYDLLIEMESLENGDIPRGERCSYMTATTPLAIIYTFALSV
jgi:hypothetical protein